ncbi:MAG: hypothetical protein ACRBCJ_13200 [Hyphomicrobiaceae bacterium]
MSTGIFIFFAAHTCAVERTNLPKYNYLKTISYCDFLDSISRQNWSAPARTGKKRQPAVTIFIGHPSVKPMFRVNRDLFSCFDGAGFAKKL